MLMSYGRPSRTSRAVRQLRQGDAAGNRRPVRVQPVARGRDTPAEELPEAFIVSFVDAADVDPALAILRTMPAVDAAIRRRDLTSR